MTLIRHPSDVRRPRSHETGALRFPCRGRRETRQWKLHIEAASGSFFLFLTGARILAIAFDSI